MEYRRNIISTEVLEDRAIPFGLLDARGREIGVQVCTSKVTMADADTAPPPRFKGYYLLKFPELTGFTVSVQSSRDGYRFGAGQRHHWAPTLTEVKAIAERLVTGSRKRYSKIGGRAA